MTNNPMDKKNSEREALRDVVIKKGHWDSVDAMVDFLLSDVKPVILASMPTVSREDLEDALLIAYEHAFDRCGGNRQTKRTYAMSHVARYLFSSFPHLESRG